MKRPTKSELSAVIDKILTMADGVPPELGLPPEAFQEIIFKPGELTFDLSAPVPIPAASYSRAMVPKAVRRTGSQKITIRVPDEVIDAFRARAKATGAKYQTLINHALKSTMPRL